MGLAFWENGCIALPFLNLAPTFGRMKPSIPLGAWIFYFILKYFAKIRVHLDLHIHRWDFSFMKKCNNKKFHKNC
jgi:hypothetical protein